MADDSKVIEILLAIQRKTDALAEGVERDRDTAKDRHITILRRFDDHEKRIAAIETARPQDPPAALDVAKEAQRTASDANLEGQSTRGMVIAVDARVVEIAKTLADHGAEVAKVSKALVENKAEVAKVAAALKENNTMTKSILENLAAPIGAILKAKPVQAAAMAVLLTALGAAGALLQSKATGPLVAPYVFPALGFDGGAQ